MQGRFSSGAYPSLPLGGGKMKIIGLVASHKRYDILKDCISCLKVQVDDIVLVGSSEWVDSAQGCNLAKKVAKEEDLIYVDHTNKILGRKWQAGLDRCKGLDPDAILICGSDDLIGNDYLDDYCNMKVAGVGSWYVYNPLEPFCITCSYKVRKDPLGAGRVIPAHRLRQYNWDIFPYESGVGCDGYSYLRTAGNKGWDNLGRVVLSVKGDWDMIDTWDMLCKATSLDVSIVNYWNDFLENNFPHIDFEKYRGIK